jgi:hypothetical protein
MKTVKAIGLSAIAIGIIAVVPLGCVIINVVGGWLGEAAQVAREEMGPRALLKKYEWFKDTVAGLDKLKADIGVYQGRLDGLAEDYREVPIIKWPRDVREQRSLWRTEVAGVKSRFNDLAAEYNAAHAKINWAFADVGDLPQGAKPLPREFRTYETK